KLNSLGQSDGQDDPVSLVEKTLAPDLHCPECIASAVTVYHFAKRDNDAARMAMRAVDEGDSPYLLLNNSFLSDLRGRIEFKRIQQTTQSMQRKCENK